LERKPLEPAKSILLLGKLRKGEALHFPLYQRGMEEDLPASAHPVMKISNDGH